MEFKSEHNLSKAKGSIKNEPEDFIVEEIMTDGTTLEIDKIIQIEDKPGKFLYFVLQKKQWSTEGAIFRISNGLHAKTKRFNWAGTKDKQAVTTQLVSGFAINKKALQNLKLKDIHINGMWTENKKVNLGDLLGNKFKIKISDLEEKAEEKIQKIHEKLNGKFVNYFGEQRFGTIRQNTHIIGQHIISEEYNEAIMEFLTNEEGEHNEDARQARINLKESLNYSKALEEFPRYLRLERTMIEWLSKYPNDYVGALRKIPRGISLLFVHAFQSYLFNLELNERVKNKDFEAKEDEYYCRLNSYGFPDIDKNINANNKSIKVTDKILCTNIIGYESETNEIEDELLARFNITKENFKLKQFQELSSKGTFRPFFSTYKDFEFNKNTNQFSFSLSSGSYATILLSEFLLI
ncbi:tRNA pseudouridine(13) synthase TruD [Candidatus Micrarchaeota archaeon]|jgi:tRNA pseudouridine13 synthase|nr:tRNA pseudouridine(13) synthase TruD [Candidatus Micrarchaeota archaeon]